MASVVHENVKSYYGSRLQTSSDLQTNATCSKPARPLPKSAAEALKHVHPEVCSRYFGCGLVIPEKLEGCKILDLGSGSGRDCYVLSKLVGKDGRVTGLDMTEEMILISQKYVQYHQEKFGYEEPNMEFVQGYMERLRDAGIESNSLDVIVSNCVICLCPDKRAVLKEAYQALKEGGEFYFSDMYASKVVPESFKEDQVLWGEGMAGALYWQDLISLTKEIGFSTPCLVSSSRIVVHNPDLQKKTGDVQYASGTYRFFKIPRDLVKTRAVVTYRGTVLDCAEQLEFDASHVFKTGAPVEVDAEMAAILQLSRFSVDFSIQKLDTPEHKQDPNPSQFCHLSPFLLADRLGCSIQQCSKTGKTGDGGKDPSTVCDGKTTTGACKQ
ncbi:arsenite methyltransferase [Chanos chanos]|uniref:Arsenite methyltransferase n=1 Tax=Chanos chanos TaxID=29144 RepID=A0A6J2VJB4_CHACN|nr:arsenite methyltransferase-like [Chanos chanos]XP_030632079.1 arsenite methyltransferase-like [Chanos chanos]XP_030632080.1 arsenite methyltransferase-like [Chanos chanos]XP_030632082.1 arsenite methyltransferase-like [Chanos chanos]